MPKYSPNRNVRMKITFESACNMNISFILDRTA